MKQGSIAITSGRLSRAFDAAVRAGARHTIVPRIMARDASVFTDKRELKELIANRLGWVDSAALMRKKIAEIETFGKGVVKAGFKHVVLMGMGGSSLCPDLFRLMCRPLKGLKSFNVIDSTDPSAVLALSRKIDLKKTLFIVASKSGGTVETRSHEAFFLGLLRDLGVKDVGRQFVAITDKGSGLHRSALKSKNRKVFLNPPDIGGRYSALSYFGLVPGYFAGVNIRALIEDALVMQKILAVRSDETNPALLLGSLIAAGAKTACNKLSFVASKKAAPLVPWIEQLVAESTGKQKKGVVPIEAEPLGTADRYASDRMFVFLKFAGERTPEGDRLKAALKKRHCAIVDMQLGSIDELGRQFLLWEAATAVAGYHLGINPFDEPNVTESKNNTKAILAAFERAGRLSYPKAHGRWGKLSLVAYGGGGKGVVKDGDGLGRILKRFLAGARPPRYFTLLNYFSSDRGSEKELDSIRKLVRDRTGMATLRGYGPRYLHSIGQLYKGGPRQGMFVVLVRSDYVNLPIPGEKFGFGELICAQAIGDAQALMSRRLPTLVVALDAPVNRGLRQFTAALRQALK
jgi:transaldolase/glucose-6-phosphate isomerase